LPEALQPALPPGYAYDSLNADALWTLTMVKGGRITLPGGASYAMLILPPDLAVTSRTARKLEELVAAGATIYGPQPSTSPSLEDAANIAATRKILDALWNPAERKHAGRVITQGDLSAVLSDLDMTPDIGAIPSGLSWTHRATPERDIYFLSNQTDALLDHTLSFRARGRQARLYDPVADREYLLPTIAVEADRMSVALRLEASGSAFLFFDTEDRTPRLADVKADRAAASVSISASRDGPLLTEGHAPGRWNVVEGNGRSHSLIVPSLPPARPIEGPWRISFDNAEHSVLTGVNQLRSWTESSDPAIRFHSGTAQYRTIFSFRPDRDWRWLLTLDDCANVAQIMLNGRDLGVIWIPGTSLDATDALVTGRNILSITVANSWRNRLIGDRKMPDQPARTWILSNRLGRAAPQKIPADAPLLPAGLIGPVRLTPMFRRQLI
jgi:hypothetical protein